MSFSQTKVVFGNNEIQNPIVKFFAILLGLAIAAAVVAGVVFFILPLVGAVLGFVLIAVAAVVLTLLALSKPLLSKVKNKEFKIDFSDDDRDYNISMDKDLELDAKALTNLEVLLEHGIVKVSESPSGDIICRTENGVLGYVQEGSRIFIKGLSKEEDRLEVLIPRNISIEIKIGKGELDLREVPVALKVKMGLGKISAFSTLSDLDVKSGNAKVFANDLAGNANLELGMGDVVLDVTPTGVNQDISIKSAKVDAKVVLPEGIPVNAKADGLKVTIDSELPIMNEAPLSINMAAALGNIEIKQKSNLIYLQ
jgi:hypothetical protein